MVMHLATGSAGLINTIQMFAQGHILAAVFGILSSIGWLLQSVGGGLLYKKVRGSSLVWGYELK
jgi:hypothetical protein